VGSKKAKKEGFNLWSDDSIEEALSQLPENELVSTSPKKQSKKKNAFSVFDDNSNWNIIAPAAIASQSAETSQSTTVSRTLSTQIQGVSLPLTPATSFGSPAPSQDADRPAFSKYLSNELADFKAAFSYHAAAIKNPLAPQPTKASPRRKPSRTYSAPTVSPPKAALIENSVMERLAEPQVDEEEDEALP